MRPWNETALTMIKERFNKLPTGEYTIHEHYCIDEPDDVWYKRTDEERKADPLSDLTIYFSRKFAPNIQTKKYTSVYASLGFCEEPEGGRYAIYSYLGIQGAGGGITSKACDTEKQLQEIIDDFFLVSSQLLWMIESAAKQDLFPALVK